MLAIVKQEPPAILIERQKQAKEKNLNSRDAYCSVNFIIGGNLKLKFTGSALPPFHEGRLIARRYAPVPPRRLHQLLKFTKHYALLSGADKKIILERLLEEQGGLCACCMRKLPDEHVPEKDYNDVQPATIEHIFPRNSQGGEEREQGLDYANLVAVCSGNLQKRRDVANLHNS